jgi:hypothetical protein
VSRRRAWPTDNVGAVPDESSAEIVIRKGSQLAGALAGGAVGMIGGPGGALGGAAVGWAPSEGLAKLGLEVMARVQGRAGERAAATALMIERDRTEHESCREGPRNDGFSDERDGLRSDEQELLEAVLLTAANTYEERKLPYLAHLFDGVRHDTSVPASDALFMSRIADQLTYRQLVGLAVFGHYDEHFRDLAHAKTLFDEGRAAPDRAFMQELDDLGTRGLVGVKGDNGLVGSPVGTWGGGMLSDIPFGKEHLTDPGEGLYRLMRLDEIPAAEREKWLTGLAGTPLA